jgi:hypothetical protein
MTTAAPTKYEILKCGLGKYVWWPSLQILEFTPKGRNRADRPPIFVIAGLSEKAVLIKAISDLKKRLREYSESAES